MMDTNTWLEKFMVSRRGRIMASVAYRAGIDEGYSRADIQKAKQALGITHTKGGLPGTWWWHL